MDGDLRLQVCQGFGVFRALGPPEVFNGVTGRSENISQRDRGQESMPGFQGCYRSFRDSGFMDLV